MKKTLILLLFFISVFSFGQTDLTRYFPSEKVHGDFHNAIASILDSSNLKEYSKIDFISVYRKFPLGGMRPYGVMSFSFINDSILQLKAYYLSDTSKYPPQISFLLRKTGSYIESDSVGSAASLEYIKTERDSSGYKIINYESNRRDMNPLSRSWHTRLLDPNERLLTQKDTFGSGEPTHENYEYRGDTIFVQSFMRSKKVEERKITTRKSFKKGKIITETTSIGWGYDYFNRVPPKSFRQVDVETKIYNDKIEILWHDDNQVL